MPFIDSIRPLLHDDPRSQVRDADQSSINLRQAILITTSLSRGCQFHGRDKTWFIIAGIYDARAEARGLDSGVINWNRIRTYNPLARKTKRSNSPQASEIFVISRKFRPVETRARIQKPSILKSNNSLPRPRFPWQPITTANIILVALHRVFRILSSLVVVVVVCVVWEKIDLAIQR